MKCPACNGKRLVQTETIGVYICKRCQALFGQCYRGQSYDFVLPYMAAEQVSPEKLRYYDLDLIGSDGVKRSHGWYDPSTKLVHQVG